MYKYVRAVGRRYGQSERWKPVNLAKVTLSEAFAEYANIWVWVTHELIDHEQVLDLNELKSELFFENVLLPTWLTTIGNRSLPIDDTPPTFETVKVRCMDLWLAGYKVTTTNPLGHPEMEYPRNDEVDLLITRPDTDYELFARHCLVSINGLIHRVDYSTSGVHVAGGGKSNLIANRNEVCGISFLDIGELTTLTIDPAKVTRSHPDQPLCEVITYDTGVDLTNKVVGVVLGGYFHLLDKVCNVVSDTGVSIQIGNTPLLERWYESKGLIDMESITLEQNPNNVEHIDRSEFFSDEVMLKYLTLPQTFIVLIDTPNLYVDRHALRSTGLPGKFVDHTGELFPLIGPLGKLMSYHREANDGQYSIAVHEAFDVNYQFTTTHWLNEPTLDNSRTTEKMKSYPQVHFWEIGKDV